MSDNKITVERTARVAASGIESLDAAFAFAVTEVDALGDGAHRIEIVKVWRYHDDGAEDVVWDVIVSGAAA